MKNRKHSPWGIVIWVAAVLILAAVSIFLINLSGEGEEFPVYISEILASNTCAPDEEGRCVDYIEIHNGGDYAVDLTGYQLGDIAGSLRYAFPSGTVIQPGQYMVIWCDKNIEGYAPFGISRSGGESFYLIAANNAVVDKVVTVATDPDEAMIRGKNQQWTLTMSPTPGLANDTEGATRDTYNKSLSTVRINEFSSAANYYIKELQLFTDWVELKNTGSDSADISGFTLSDNTGNDKYTFPTGTVIEPGAYFVVCCDETVPGFAPFGLSQKMAETLVLKDQKGMIVEVVESKPLEKGAYALQADGSWQFTEQLTPGYENTEQGFAEYIRTMGVNDIQISEVMSDQDLFYADGSGAFKDWIELYNCSDKTVDLTGWWLSDDETKPDKWIFPETTIEPGEYLLLICTGEGGPDFNLSSDGETVVLSTVEGMLADQVTFGKAERNCSFDGEGAVVTKPTPGYENTDAGYDTFINGYVSAGPLAIWEVMTSNDQYMPQALGICYDWVEIKNISDQPVNLAQFTLTDEPDSPQRFTLPDVTLEPGAVEIIFLSGDDTLGDHYAPFALNAYEDRLLLYSADGLVDYVLLTNIPVGMSYGRMENCGGFYYMEPSPQNPNTAGYREISGMPQSGYAPGVYSGEEFTLELTANGSIYYTVNGDEPSAASTLYTEPIVITETTALRAISCEEGKLPSKIYNVTFVVGREHDLPVVSLVTDPDYLWGVNGVYKNGDESVKEIHFPANVAYSGSDGSFSIDNEMSLHGVTTVVAFNKKSFTLRFKDYLDGALHYDVFEDGEVTAFRSLLLRTSHEDVYSTQLHDALMSEIAQQGGDTLIVQKYKYVALYLNGEYWGLYAIREQHTEEHFASYKNVLPETVSMVRYSSDEQNSLNQLYKFCKNNSMAYEENYAYAKTVLNMESFADWIIFQAYIKNIDIYENVRFYQSSVDGLWHLALSDLDMGFMSTGSGFEELQTTFHHGLLVRSMMANEEFKKLMAQRLAYWLSGPLSDENMVATIDKIAAIIANETVYEQQRWGTPVSGWESFVSSMKRYCTGHAEQMKNDFCNVVGWTRVDLDKYFEE